MELERRKFIKKFLMAGAALALTQPTLGDASQTVPTPKRPSGTVAHSRNH